MLKPRRKHLAAKGVRGARCLQLWFAAWTLFAAMLLVASVSENSQALGALCDTISGSAGEEASARIGFAFMT